jgi:RNA polymerase sigma-70 factor (ECF subfamily)
MARSSDEQMMIKFQQGDVHAFEFLFEKYRVPVFNFAFRMLNRERDAAEDLLQEIFNKVCRARELYEPKAKFSTWLFSISRNHCLNFLKSRRYIQSGATVSLDAQTGKGSISLHEQLAMQDATPEDGHRRDLRDALEWAISSLSDSYKEVFLLHAVEGFTHGEIAKILGTTPGTVRTRFHRARTMLRKRIGNVAEGDTNNEL